jgi:hypothetical protein
MMEDMKRNVRPLTGPEMRALCFVLLNARDRFKKPDYHCFRKFAKVAFDLGSVSVYEQEAVGLFVAIQASLRDRLLEGEGSERDSEYAAPLRGTNPKLDIYAPKEGGGYEE